MERWWDLVNSLPPELTVVVVGASPIIELRGAIPLGMVFGLGPVASAVYGYVGTMIPVPVLLAVLSPVCRLIVGSRPGRAIVDFLHAKTHYTQSQVTRSGLIALVVLCAIPLPVTGAWTASVAASFLGLNRLSALVAIATGTAIAAVVVTLLVMGGWTITQIR